MDPGQLALHKACEVCWPAGCCGVWDPMHHNFVGPNTSAEVLQARTLWLTSCCSSSLKAVSLATS